MRIRPKIILTCPHCGTSFTKAQHHFNAEKRDKPEKIYFCSTKCESFFFKKIRSSTCNNCGKDMIVNTCNDRKIQNTYCSKSCAATYNNQHKTHGTRRSKLECYLALELAKLFPNLEIHFNRKDAINSELDIYIPSLKLAFELNGIFHYEPIYGAEKLSQIKNNDNRKYQACLEHGIELCIIDTTHIKHFNSKKADVYVEIITDLVNNKLLSIPNYEEVL
jgi:hypothetical protein